MSKPFVCVLLLMAAAASDLRAQQTQPVGTAASQAAALLAAQQIVFQHALERVTPAMVRIDTIGGALPIESGNTPDGQEIAQARYRQADGPTTGVILDADGFILTSSINFMRDPQVITVTLADGRRLVAKLVARDRPARLALLKVNATGLTPAEWLTPDAIRPGQWALTAGYGLGSKRPALSAGIVSAVQRTSGMTVQTDAKTSPTNYGGPLFDVEGRLLGIIVPQAGDEDELAGVDWYDSGIGFAVRRDFLDARLPRLRQGDNLQRGLMGIQVAPASADTRPTDDGIRVAGVSPGPAKDAGLLAEDRIRALNDVPIRHPLELRRVLARYAAGDTLRVRYTRGNEGTPLEQTVELKLITAEELAALQPPEGLPTTMPATMPATMPSTRPGPD